MYLSDFETYFSQLAENHKAINKFYPGRGLLQILEGIGSNIKYKYLSLERFESSLTDNHSDNKMRTIRGIFYVMDKPTEQSKSTEVLRKKAECMNVCEDIIRAMYFDSKCNLNPTISGFDLNSIEMTEVPSRADAQVGFAVAFDINVFFDIRTESNNWNTPKENWKTF